MGLFTLPPDLWLCLCVHPAARSLAVPLCSPCRRISGCAAVFTLPADLWLCHCVQVLDSEQPTLEEKLREKYKGEKVYIHVYLRMLMFLLNRQQV